MIDREKLIKVIEDCLEKGACNECPYKIGIGWNSFNCRRIAMLRDCLYVLREQSEIVRCKDCKHSEYINGQGYKCEVWEYSYVLNNGFCNYGERRAK